MSESKSSEQWRELYDTCLESGCSKAAFCRQLDLNYHQFLYWCDKFSNKPKKLIPVEISSIGAPLASIRLSNGSLLEISSMAALTLTTLFSASFLLNNWLAGLQLKARA